MEITEQQLRLECLKAVTASLINGVDINAEAEKLYAFVTANNPVKVMPDEEPHVTAYAELCRRANAKRRTWRPDWSDSNQKKWYPWFEYKNGGFVVAGTDYYYDYTCTDVGSRLCFPTSEMVKEFANENIDLYRIILSN